MLSLDCQKLSAWAFLVVFLLPAVAGCAISSGAPPVSAYADPEAGFGSYRSYAFADPAYYPAALRRYDFPDGDMNRIKVVAAEAMRARGFEPMPPDLADLLIHVSVGERTRPDAIPGESQSLALQERLAQLEPDTESNTLVIDALDRQTGRHVWQGRSLLLAQRREDSLAAIEVETILRELPKAAEGPAPVSIAPAAPAFGAPLEPSEEGVPGSNPYTITPNAAEPESPAAASDSDWDAEFGEGRTPSATDGAAAEGPDSPDTASDGRSPGEPTPETQEPTQAPLAAEPREGPAQESPAGPSESEPSEPEPPTSEFDDEF